MSYNKLNTLYKNLNVSDILMKLFVVFPVPPGECPGGTLKLGHDHFHLHFSPDSLFTDHSFIRCYIVLVTEKSSLNKLLINCNTLLLFFLHLVLPNCFTSLGFRLKLCVHFSSAPCILNVPPSFLIHSLTLFIWIQVWYKLLTTYNNICLDTFFIFSSATLKML
jgi:hypothetical protein